MSPTPVKVERALVERNEALEAADSLKNAFIQHVSYELRSPLTNIIGFAQLLADSRVGPLNGKQRDYTGYILSSSAALLAIVNDILDLATVDAGIMELDLADIDIAETVDAAIEGVQDRVRESEIRHRDAHSSPASAGSSPTPSASARSSTISFPTPSISPIPAAVSSSPRRATAT